MTILGNREHKKTNFRFLGNGGTSQFISGEQVTPPGRASMVNVVIQCNGKVKGPFSPSVCLYRMEIKSLNINNIIF